MVWSSPSAAGTAHGDICHRHQPHGQCHPAEAVCTLAASTPQLGFGSRAAGFCLHEDFGSVLRARSSACHCSVDCKQREQ